MTRPGPSGTSGPIAVQEPIAKLVRDLVHERTGIFFDDNRMDTMLEKLEPLAHARSCKSYLDYYYILKYDAAAAEEWHRVMDAFSVQETYFWREFDQVRALIDVIVPEWFKKTSLPFRIWSAACATGDEPYSIAIALEEAGWGSHPIQILASDASDGALEKARAAVYRERAFRVLPPELKEKYFERFGDDFALKKSIRQRVTFRWGNLMHLEDLPESLGMNAIFCRNVFIYFSPDSIRPVLDAFAARLPVGGPLFVGASESLLKLTEKFDLKEISGAFTYVRTAKN